MKTKQLVHQHQLPHRNGEGNSERIEEIILYQLGHVGIALQFPTGECLFVSRALE